MGEKEIKFKVYVRKHPKHHHITGTKYKKEDEQSCINQATEVAGDAAVADRRCANQATRVAGSAAVADARSTSQATRVASSAALADEKYIQTTKLASEQALISKEVLELIEAVPHHEFFIPEH